MHRPRSRLVVCHQTTTSPMTTLRGTREIRFERKRTRNSAFWTKKTKFIFRRNLDENGQLIDRRKKISNSELLLVAQYKMSADIKSTPSLQWNKSTVIYRNAAFLYTDFIHICRFANWIPYNIWTRFGRKLEILTKFWTKLVIFGGQKWHFGQHI